MAHLERFAMRQLLLAALITLTVAAQGQTGKYSNHEYGYSILFPRLWAVTESVLGDYHKVTATNNYRGTDHKYGEISVIVIPNTSAGKLRGIMDGDVEIAGRLGKSAKVIKNIPTILNEYKAIQVEILITGMDNRKSRMVNFGIAQKNNLYVIRCFADEDYYQEYLKLFRTTCETFRISP